MQSELLLVLGIAAVLGVTHTLFGPDHYLPFIALARARGWDMSRTAMITTICGCGHVLSSILIGIIAIRFGSEFLNLDVLEDARGAIAAWGLFSFGVAYTLWGLRRAKRQAYEVESAKSDKMPWILFVILVVGPCETLIPLLMTSAASLQVGEVIAVSAVFLVTTVATMTTMVIVGYMGIDLLPFLKVRQYAHAVAGGAVTTCAAVLLFLGL